MGRINTTITNPSDTISTTISSVQGINDISFTSSGTVTATINPDTIIQTTISDSATGIGNVFRDTANVGSLLGVDFTDTLGVVTATVDASTLTASSTSIPDWDIMNDYLEDQVSVYSMSGSHNIYRAINDITSAGTPLAPVSALAEQGTITVDNAALVGTGGAAHEVVTLAVSGDTGTDTFGPVTSPVDITNTRIVSVNFTPPSSLSGLSNVSFFSLDGQRPRLTADGNNSRQAVIRGVSRSSGAAAAFPASTNRAELITNLNNHFVSGAVDFSAASGFPTVGLTVNFRANPDNSTDIIFEVLFTSFSGQSVTVAPQSGTAINLITPVGTPNFALATNGTVYAGSIPSRLRIVSGSIDETLDLTAGLMTQAAIAADIVTEFNANANLRTLFDAATVNAMNQVVFQTTATGDIPLTISEIPNSGTLVVQEAIMDGVAGSFTAPVIRLLTPEDTATLTDIALQSSSDADAIAALISAALNNNGYSATVANNVISYSRDLTGAVTDLRITVQTQGTSNLVNAQFAINVTQQGRNASADPRVPSLDTLNWELLGSTGGGAGTTYQFFDTANVSTTLGVDFTVDGNNNVTATVDASGISGGGTANTFMDTSNVGTTLGVDFSVSAANVVTATVDASNIPGGNVTPPERFLFTVSPRSISEGTGNQTVTVSGIGVVAPFTYTGFTRTEVHGPAGSIPTTPQSGTGTSFTFEIPRDQVGTYAVSFVIESENAAGVAQPNHTATSSVRVNADWYADALTTAPTALTDLTSRGAYNDGVSYRFPALVNGRAYIALPNSVASPRFRSGALFLTPMTTATIGTTHMLYTLSADDYNGDGTLNVEVN